MRARRLTTGVLLCCAVACAAAPVVASAHGPVGESAVAATPSTEPGLPTSEETTTTVEATTTTVEVLSGADSGAATEAPSFSPSAPLIPTPTGCPEPPRAAIVFVGDLLATDRHTARYRVAQIRAGSGEGFIVRDLIDVGYDDETQQLSVGTRYLVGAGRGGDGRLFSRVEPADALFGGDAVIGVTESDADCPVIEDPLRTLHADGTEIATSMFVGLGGAKKRIAFAFIQPFLLLAAAIVVLALIRWLFTAIFVSARRAADVEPITAPSGGGRQHLPDLDD